MHWAPSHRLGTPGWSLRGGGQVVPGQVSPGELQCPPSGHILAMLRLGDKGLGTEASRQSRGD